MDIIFAIVVGIFSLLVIASLCLQIYVAMLLRSGNIFFALRGTKVFIQGWQQADHLKIKPLMTVWTWIIVLMLLFICPMAVAGYMRNADSQETDRSSRPATSAPQIVQGEITSPQAGAILRQSDGEVPIIGYVIFRFGQVEKFQFWIRNSTQTAGFGSDYYSPVPEPNSVLETFNPSLYPPGKWEIALDIVPQSEAGRIRAPEDLDWIPITIVP